MTNLRKYLGVSTFAIFALAFCCLLIGQAAIAKVDKVVVDPNADDSIVKAVPLPTMDRSKAGQSGSALSAGQPPAKMSESQEAIDFPLLLTDLKGIREPVSNWRVEPIEEAAVKAPCDWNEVEACGAHTNDGNYFDPPICDDASYYEDFRYPYSLYPTKKLCGTLWVDDPSADPHITGVTRDVDCYIVQHDPAATLSAVLNLVPGLWENSTVYLLTGALADCFPGWGWGYNLDGGYQYSGLGDLAMEPGDEACFMIRPQNNPGPDCTEPAGYDYYFYTTLRPLTPIDDCPMAREIAGEGQFIQDMCTMTTDGPLDCRYSGYGVGYEGNPWFLWECEETGLYTLSCCNTPWVGGYYGFYDLYMGVWYGPSGCPEDACMEMAFNEDGDACAPDWEPEITEFIAAEGVSYYITLGSWNYYYGDPCGDAWLDITRTGPVPLYGDDCDVDAIPIAAETLDEFFHNLNATLDGPDPSACNAGSFGGDIWYQMTAWETGTAYVEFCDVNFDANLEVYEGFECPVNPDPRDPIRCNDDGCWQDLRNWPIEHGSYTSFPVTEDDEILLRVGGWYNPPDNPLEIGGMGYGTFSIFIDDHATVSPVNDFCVDVTPVVLADGVVDTRVGLTDYATRNDMDLVCAPPEEEMKVWEAFTVSEGVCMEVQVDYFGSPDRYSDNNRYDADAENGLLWIGCPCEGDFFSIQAAVGCLNLNECVYPGDFNNIFIWPMMPAGDYWFPVSQSSSGLLSHWFDYNLNITGAVIDCEYCLSTANYAMCTDLPMITGLSWIDDVSFDGVALTTGTGCMGYEDHSDIVSGVYRGITYTVTATMYKHQQVPGVHDFCDVWIDWNQNSVFFDAGEHYVMTRFGYDWSAEFTVPLEAVLEDGGASMETRMRIKLSSDADGSPSYCGEVTWGETEDYGLMVTDIECGDFDDNGADPGDIDFLRDWYYGGTTLPDYWQRADLDGDCAITIADVILLADYVHGRVLSVDCIQVICP